MGNRPILIHNPHVRIGQAPKEFEVQRVEPLAEGLVRIWRVTGIRRNESPELKADEAEVRREMLAAHQWPCVLTSWGWVDRNLFGITILFPDDLGWAFLKPGGESKFEIRRNELGRLELALSDGTSVDVSFAKEGKFVHLVYHCSEIKISVGDWEGEGSLANAQADLIVGYPQKDTNEPPIVAQIFPSFATHLPGGALLLLGDPSGKGTAYFCPAAGRESLMKIIRPQRERQGMLSGLPFVRRGW